MKKWNIYIYLGLLLSAAAIILTYKTAGDTDEAIVLVGIETICALVLIIFYYKERERQLRLEAQIDRSTGLLSKSATENTISELTRSPKHKKYALMVVDIDNFKNVNDTFGHETGDRAIVHTAHILRSAFPDDVVGRIGGDEFVALYRYTYPDDPCKKAEEIKSLFADYSISEGNDMRLSVSIGISDCPDTGSDYKTLFEEADKKLYQVKKGGKNSYMM